MSTHTLTWSVTCLSSITKFSQIISTHTLTWSVTYCFLNFIFYFLISTHTLTWSVTCFLSTITSREDNISTHTLTWSVTAPTDTCISGAKFQLTRSRGAWLAEGLPVFSDFAFQLTRSRGAWLLSLNSIYSIPHYISTHTLTWSVTIGVTTSQQMIEFQLTRSRGAWRSSICSRHTLEEISTHTLTWSVTVLENVASIDFTFQLTRSRGAWLTPCHFLRTECQFQLTRSRGAWPGKLRQTQSTSQISTHTLTWSVTCTN